MDALVATFVEDLKQRVAGMYNEDPDGNMFNDSSSTEADGKFKKVIVYWLGGKNHWLGAIQK